MLNSYLLVS